MIPEEEAINQGCEPDHRWDGCPARCEPPIREEQDNPVEKQGECKGGHRPDHRQDRMRFGHGDQRRRVGRGGLRDQEEAEQECDRLVRFPPEEQEGRGEVDCRGDEHDRRIKPGDHIGRKMEPRQPFSHDLGGRRAGKWTGGHIYPKVHHDPVRDGNGHEHQPADPRQEQPASLQGDRRAPRLDHRSRENRRGADRWHSHGDFSCSGTEVGRNES